MKRRFWTPAEDAILRELYPATLTSALAQRLQRSVSSVYYRADQLGLRKDPDWVRANCRLTQGTTIGAASRYRKGQKPQNAGVKGWQAGGRAAETQFRKGAKPQTWVPVGTEVTDPDGYRKRKVRDDAPPGMSRKNWRFVHVLLWEEHHGPVPPGHNVQFTNGNRADIRIENLELVSRRANMNRNTKHRLPDDLKEVLQLKAVLTRIINQKERPRGQEQNRRPA